MNPNDFDRQCPDFAGGFKFAAALVVIGLIIAASESSINWLPTTTLHDVAANEATSAQMNRACAGPRRDARKNCHGRRC